MFASTRNSKIENDDPRNANLGPHLQINRTEAWVEGSSHKEIVDEISRHTNRSLRGNSVEIGDERDSETVDHTHSHKMTVIVNNLGKAEDTSPMENERNNDGGVPTLKGVAVIHESLVSKRRDRKAFLFKARENPGNEELEEEKSRIHFPRVKIRTGILQTVQRLEQFLKQILH